MTSAPAIGFEYRPPRLLRRVLLLMAALALLAIALSAVPTGLKLLLVIAVALLTWHALHRLAANPVAAAGWGADDVWTLRLRNQEDVAATLVSFRTLGGLVLLRLRTTGQGVQVLLLVPDNSDADTRRRLRMRLATVQLDEALPRI
ncbi:MAG TPA: protein YgfX [Rhodanobacter sp.]